MSLLSFQKALTDLIASPRLCVEARHHPDQVFNRYNLTLLERMRLRTVIFQKGMSVSCTLYRVNRITPIYTMLPYTCLLLGGKLIPLVEEFWEVCRKSDLQFKREIEGFVSFLQTKIAASNLQDPYLLEILLMEAAINELKFLPREQLLQQEWDDTLPHPLIRSIPFDHEPEPLLYELSNMRIPPYTPETGSWILVIDYRHSEMTLSSRMCYRETCC